MKEPNPYDYGLLESDVGRAALAVERGKRINRYAAWLCFLLGVFGGLALGHFFGVLFGLVGFFGLTTLGLHISDSKQLVKFWNYNDRHVIEGYYRYEAAKIHYKIWLDKTKRDYWGSLSGREFEYEIAALFRSHGYQARVTPTSGDKGVDIVLSNSGKVIVVQCKRYKRPAGPATARELYGALIDSGADEAIFVCTAGFTSGVYDFVQDKPIRLMDLDDILEMQQQISSTIEASEIVPYHEWVQVWLQTHADRPNIKESLDDYIEENELFTPNLNEPREITETRIRITILQQSLEHVWPELRVFLEEKLHLFEQLLELLEEKREIQDRMAKRYETVHNELETFDNDESPSELDSVRAEMLRIHNDVSAGRISSHQARNQLDKIGEILDRMEREELRREAEKEGFFENMGDKSNDLLELLAESIKNQIHIEKGIEERRIEKELSEHTGNDNSPSEWDWIHDEMDRIYYNMKAGAISGQEALKQLDELEKEMERIDLEEARKEAEKEVERLVKLYQKGDQN